jgi:hypothetical protein
MPCSEGKIVHHSSTSLEIGAQKRGIFLVVEIIQGWLAGGNLPRKQFKNTVLL